MRARWSPEQIAGILARGFPDTASYRVSHETIYTAVYLVPRGELRKELIGCLRQGRSTRKPRTRGTDRRGQIPDMQSIHVRPPEVADRLIPGHWEGDLIKGAGNRSSVGTLVERKSGLLRVRRIATGEADPTMRAVIHSLHPLAVRGHTITWDNGSEFAEHALIDIALGAKSYFADPYSSWQRGSNENTNGLLRQYFPKGCDLSTFSEAYIQSIEDKLNQRPRKRLRFHSPQQIFDKSFKRALPN